MSIKLDVNFNGKQNRVTLFVIYKKEKEKKGPDRFGRF